MQLSSIIQDNAKLLYSNTDSDSEQIACFPNMFSLRPQNNKITSSWETQFKNEVWETKTRFKEHATMFHYTRNT